LSHRHHHHHSQTVYILKRVIKTAVRRNHPFQPSIPGSGTLPQITTSALSPTCHSGHCSSYLLTSTSYKAKYENKRVNLQPRANDFDKWWIKWIQINGKILHRQTEQRQFQPLMACYAAIINKIQTCHTFLNVQDFPKIRHRTSTFTKNHFPSINNVCKNVYDFTKCTKLQFIH